jgi:hypothetical protein
MKDQYYFTKHALERFKDRFKHKMIGTDAVRSLSEAVRGATPDNSIHNDTKFMTEYYEKYGYDREPIFLVTNDIVFVVKDTALITMYERTTSRFRAVRNRYKSTRRN